MRRIAAVILEGPVRDALLAKVGDLQMSRPLREGEVSLDHRCQALVQIGPVAWNPRAELRNELGVIEPLFLLRAQVRLRAAHPEHVAVDDHLAMAETPAVVVDETFESEREQTVEAAIHEFPRLAGLLTQKMRQRAVPHD